MKFLYSGFIVVCKYSMLYWLHNFIISWTHLLGIYHLCLLCWRYWFLFKFIFLITLIKSLHILFFLWGSVCIDFCCILFIMFLFCFFVNWTIFLFVIFILNDQLFNYFTLLKSFFLIFLRLILILWLYLMLLNNFIVFYYFFLVLSWTCLFIRF